MICYRICNSLYKDDLSGTGAKLYGGRWNTKGQPMLYASEHVSLAVLEMLVHSRFKDFSIELSLLQLQLPINIEVKEVRNSKLKTNWIEDFEYTKFMGDEFIKNSKSLVLKVPSAVINRENNLLVNPLHPEFKKIKITETVLFKTDKRLFSIP